MVLIADIFSSGEKLPAGRTGQVRHEISKFGGKNGGKDKDVFL
jgi:hypothetical protein